MDAGMQMPGGIGVEIHGILCGGLDVIDKFPPARAQVQHLSVRGDKSAEVVVAEDLPDRVAVLRGPGKANPVFVLKHFGFVTHGARFQRFFSRMKSSCQSIQFTLKK